MSKKKPIIVITMGDPSGIGPEIIAKALSQRTVYDICQPVVVGDAQVMEAASNLVLQNFQVNSIDVVQEAGFQFGYIDILDLKNIDINTLQRGKVDHQSGRAAVEYVKSAIDLTVKGETDAIATAPLNKEAMNLAGFPYPGHTELLAETTGVENYAMMLLADPLRIVHVTTHVALRRVSDLIKKERITNTIQLTDRALRTLGITTPKIAVAGLNLTPGKEASLGQKNRMRLLRQ